MLIAAELLAGSTAILPLAVIPKLAATANSDGFTIRKQVNEAQIHFSVRDSHGRLVKGLRQGDFNFATDGQSTNAITSFYEHDDLPLRLVVMMDVSDSMEKYIPGEGRTAEMFLNRVIRPDTDQVSLVTFSATARITQTKPVLMAASLKSLDAGGQTALYDTIFDYSQSAVEHPESKPVGRVILLFSDGEDNWSRHNLAETVVMAQQAGVTIYPVAVHSGRVEFAGDRVLRILAESTGGRAFIPSRYEQLAKLFASIEDEIHTGYVVGLRPQPTPGFHTVNIATHDRKMKVQAKSGYYNGE